MKQRTFNATAPFEFNSAVIAAHDHNMQVKITQYTTIISDNFQHTGYKPTAKRCTPSETAHRSVAAESHGTPPYLATHVAISDEDVTRSQGLRGANYACCAAATAL